MDKSRVIIPVLMGGVITLFVTVVVTMPLVRRATERIVALFERRA
jgi:hypothetical protein